MNSSNIPAVWHGWDGVETGLGIVGIGYDVDGVVTCVVGTFKPFKPSVIIIIINIYFFIIFFIIII